jgi:phage FluMu protein Com
MQAMAMSWDCRKLEKDPTPVAGVTVDCPRCDEDNPLAVARAKCPECKGTGRAPVLLTVIVTELHASRLELLDGGKDQGKKRFGGSRKPSQEEEVSDEWCDPDDLCD